LKCQTWVNTIEGMLLIDGERGGEIENVSVKLCQNQNSKMNYGSKYTIDHFAG